MINENGKFYKEYDMFYFNNEISMDSRFTLTTIKEFPVFYGQLDEILPIGSHICITGTDNVGVITFYNLDTEQSGEIFIEHGVGEDSWMIYIDGCSQFDYFEYIPYAD